MINTFNQRKKSILSKSDKSNIGKWDEKIISLCNKINNLENYYTTSSCSGRVVLMIDEEKKAPNLFLAVSHDLISFDWLKKKLNELTKSPASPTTTPNLKNARSSFARICLDSINNKALRDTENNVDMITTSKVEKSGKADFGASIKNKPIKFKCEPPILHIACKNLESAFEFLKKAKKSGLKHSGINSLGKNIILEINGSDKLEFPIINKGEILVSDDFLELVVQKSNEKLKKSWKMIEMLENESE